MKIRLLALSFLVSGCSIIGHPLTPNSCHVNAAGDWDSRFADSWMNPEQLQESVDATLDSLQFTSDPRLQDTQAACGQLAGWNVYTVKAEQWDSWGVMIQGSASCWNRVIKIHTPPSHRWEETALVHEFMHVIQGCEALKPIDSGSDEDHANWQRDGVWSAIDAANGHK